MSKGATLIATLSVLMLPGLCMVHAVQAQEGKMNILFIAVDDLRTELGCYGKQTVHSPHIDRLASTGMVFHRAYCQQAICNASRASLMTGRRPDTTKVWNLKTHFRQALPDVVTLPQHFKQHGYYTLSFGKIYHGGRRMADPPSWSIPAWHPAQGMLRKAVFTPAMQERWARTPPGSKKGWPAWHDPDVSDDVLPDGAIADEAIKAMKQIRNGRMHGMPFFLAVGFLKPHLPFYAPKKYYDLYPMEGIRLPDNMQPPRDFPAIASYRWGELRAYRDIPQEGAVSERQALELIRGYHACVSYTDAQVGRLLDALEAHQCAENTIVILWGDHGWKLGEHGMWCKHTNFELDTRAPLILRVPGRTSQGIHTDALVEFVDIFPSLSELCGLPVPEGLEGTSFVALLDNPERVWKRCAFSQYPRRSRSSRSESAMGYSMRTDRYRYTQWLKISGRWNVTEEVVGEELYDHRKDPCENVNIAHLPENQELLRELRRTLLAGWPAVAAELQNVQGPMDEEGGGSR